MIAQMLQSPQRHTEQRENTYSPTTSFPNEQVYNADLYKPVLNEIMIRQEYCIKYNFGVPLKSKLIKVFKTLSSKILLKLKNFGRV